VPTVAVKVFTAPVTLIVPPPVAVNASFAPELVSATPPVKFTLGGCRRNGRRGRLDRAALFRRGGVAGCYARRQSLSRLWVAQISFHSLSAAASPRRDRLRIWRLCLI